MKTRQEKSYTKVNTSLVAVYHPMITFFKPNSQAWSAKGQRGIVLFLSSELSAPILILLSWAKVTLVRVSALLPSQGVFTR